MSTIQRKDEFMSEYRCAICGRKLKNLKSIRRRVGNTCEKKLLEELYKNQMNLEELECMNLKYQEK